MALLCQMLDQFCNKLLALFKLNWLLVPCKSRSKPEHPVVLQKTQDGFNNDPVSNLFLINKILFSIQNYPAVKFLCKLPQNVE